MMYSAYQSNKKDDKWTVSWYGFHNSNVLGMEVDCDTALAVATAMNEAYNMGTRDANDKVRVLENLLFNDGN